jgi:hypothetical protein
MLAQIGLLTTEVSSLKRKVEDMEVVQRVPIHANVTTEIVVPPEPYVCLGPLHLPSVVLKDLQVDTLLYTWFAHEQHKDLQVLAGVCKQNMKKISRCITYLKAFLPVGTIINEKPTEAAALKDWLLEITNLSKLAFEGAVSWCSNPDNQVVKYKGNSIPSAFPGMYKRLNNKALICNYPQHTVEDLATSPHYLYESVSTLDFRL